MSKLVWEEIHGFSSLDEYRRFVSYLEKQIASMYVEEIEVDSQYSRGEIFGGRWFRDTATREVWRLIPPDFPFRGLWEPVAS